MTTNKINEKNLEIEVDNPYDESRQPVISIKYKNGGFPVTIASLQSPYSTKEHLDKYYREDFSKNNNADELEKQIIDKCYMATNGQYIITVAFVPSNTKEGSYEVQVSTFYKIIKIVKGLPNKQEIIIPAEPRKTYIVDNLEKAERKKRFLFSLFEEQTDRNFLRNDNSQVHLANHDSRVKRVIEEYPMKLETMYESFIRQMRNVSLEQLRKGVIVSFINYPRIELKLTEEDGKVNIIFSKYRKTKNTKVCNIVHKLSFTKEEFEKINNDNLLKEIFYRIVINLNKFYKKKLKTLDLNPIYLYHYPKKNNTCDTYQLLITSFPESMQDADSNNKFKAFLIKNEDIIGELDMVFGDKNNLALLNKDKGESLIPHDFLYYLSKDDSTRGDILLILGDVVESVIKEEEKHIAIGPYGQIYGNDDSSGPHPEQENSGCFVRVYTPSKNLLNNKDHF